MIKSNKFRKILLNLITMILSVSTGFSWASKKPQQPRMSNVACTHSQSSFPSIFTSYQTGKLTHREWRNVAENLLTRLMISTTDKLLLEEVLTDEKLIEIVQEMEPKPNCVDLNSAYRFTSEGKVRTQPNALTDVGLENLAKLCPLLFEVDLGEARHISDQGIIALVRRHPWLRKLTVRWCKKVTDQSLETLAYYCPHLEEANFLFCRRITDKGLSWLAQGCSYMRKISVSGASLADSGYFAYWGETLSKLDLTDCNLNDDDVQGITSLCPLLTAMLIGGNPALTDRAIAILATNCPYLTEIDLTQFTLHHYYYQQQELTDVSLYTLAHTCSFLKKITLRGLRGITDEGVKELAVGCKDLEKIDFTNCARVTVEGIRYLVSHCPKLRKVGLSVCCGYKNYTGITLEFVRSLREQGLKVKVTYDME